jgi:hypothetical protein
MGDNEKLQLYWVKGFCITVLASVALHGFLLFQNSCISQFVGKYLPQFGDSQCSSPWMGRSSYLKWDDVGLIVVFSFIVGCLSWWYGKSKVQKIK